MRPASQDTIARRIRSARKSRGLNQRQLGELTGKGQSTVCMWERGADESDPRGGYVPERECWETVASALGTTVVDLFFESDEAAAG